MHTFQDKNGKKWSIELNVGTAKRVKSECGIDLVNVITLTREGKLEATALERLADDPVLLVDCLFVLCREQAGEAGLDDFGFAALFDAAAVDTAAIRAAEGVETLSLVLEQGAMAEVGDRRTIVRLRGVERTYEDVVPVAQTIYGGTFAVGVDDSRSVVLGHRTAQELGMSRQAAGDMVTLYAINRARFSSLLPVGGYTRRTLPVAGFYSIDDENGDVAYVSLDVAQDMFNYEGRASAVAVKLAAGADADVVAERLQRIAGEGMEVLTRERSNSIYRLMALEKWGVFAVALIVLVVASLTVVGTIVMIMIDKRDDAATLRMMGASRATVRDIFVGEGHLLAVVSLVLGVAAGVGLTLLQQTVGLVRLPLSVNIGDRVRTLVKTDPRVKCEAGLVIDRQI